MHEIALFVEDHAYRMVVGTLVDESVDPENPPAPVVLAVPDPHVDAGCCLTVRPSRPCSVRDARLPTGNAAGIATRTCWSRPSVTPAARPIWIVRNMDIERAARLDGAFNRSSPTCARHFEDENDDR